MLRGTLQSLIHSLFDLKQPLTGFGHFIHSQMQEVLLAQHIGNIVPK
jgi:hypothetical protein